MSQRQTDAQRVSAPLRVALVVMPFASCDRPNLAVGLLAAALAREGIDCEIKHFNLMLWKLLGHARYQQLSELLPNTVMAGEWLFSQVFYAQQVSDWSRYEREVLDDPLWGVARDRRPVIREALELAPMFVRLAFESNDWSRHDLVGFTSTFEQTMASLCLARMIRGAHPQLRIALGGANFEAGMGRPYLEHYPFVDYVSIGEADRSFPTLCRRLARAKAAGRELDAIELPPGMLGRRASKAAPKLAVLGRPAEITEDLDDLPIPEFRPFFASAAAISEGLAPRAGTPSDPWLMVETSRGCWWGRKHHCTFCGLNGETMGFRRKSATRVLAELDTLEARHGRRVIQFTDNILAHEFFADLLPAWAEEPEPARKFFEIKANLRRTQVELLARAGIDRIQPGIESLDDATLAEMAKGVSAAQNIALLRWCAELGIRAYWNILYGFPRERADSYARTLALLERITHLTAPTACSLIRLDRFSPNFDDWRGHGFSAIAPLPVYRHLFPFDDETLGELAYFFRYEHPRLREAVAGGRELVAFVRRWRAAQSEAVAPRLAVELGAHGFELIDERLDRPPLRRRLDDIELAVLLGCDQPRKRAACLAHADAAGPGAERALERLLDDGVVLELGGALVSVALLPSPATLEAAPPAEHRLPSWLHRSR